MLNKNGERELAYVVKIDDIRPIDGADRVELAVVGGWTVMVRKNQFKPEDLAVYFEIDSKVPETETFKFLEGKHYKIKTQKYFKGKVISQGLLMGADDFGWSVSTGSAGKVIAIGGHAAGDFLTAELGVTYAEESDRKRKGNPEDKYKKMAGRHPRLFRNPIIKKLYKTKFGKKALFVFLGSKSDKGIKWPEWVVKTDEERVQNMPWILTDKSPWIETEKVDGTSTTFTMKRGKKRWFRKTKNEFYVCSRNVAFTHANKNKACFYSTNVYTEMADKYSIECVLQSIMSEHPEYDWATLQGETYGDGIQKRNYSLVNCHDFKGFNFITSADGRWNSVDAAKLFSKYGIEWVPIVDESFILPDSVEELLKIATGKSVIDGGMREGLVFRSQDGKKSFKAVSNEYLLKYHE